ncbi:MAG: phosphotransferase [Candidatus Obscuribacter sp.]|nr:phosphotransferase [Candidatus Obscuribacter sp.]
MLADVIAGPLAGESISLTHGDLYAENIILRADKLFIIDWSWFAMLGVPLVDIATITMQHHKNGVFDYRQDLPETYCFESGRQEKGRTCRPAPCPRSQPSAFPRLVGRAQIRGDRRHHSGTGQSAHGEPITDLKGRLHHLS